MHWVYVFLCDEDKIYVGETTGLFHRFTSHIMYRGSKFTQKYRPRRLVGLYKISHGLAFNNYDSCVNRDNFTDETAGMWKDMRFDLISIKLMKEWDTMCVVNNHRCSCKSLVYKGTTLENAITRQIMSVYGYQDVRGGFYTSSSSDIHEPRKTFRPNRPLCHCMFPAEIRKTDYGKLYFVCSLKNIWKSFYNVNVQEPCSFYAEYHGDKIKIESHKQAFLNTMREKRECLIDYLFTEPLFAR